jgi:hypothetical protein
MGSKERLQPIVPELSLQDVSDACEPGEDLCGTLSVEGLDVSNGASPRQECGNDSACGCAGDEIKTIRQHGTVLRLLRALSVT